MGTVTGRIRQPAALMHAEAKRRGGACVTPTKDGKERPGDTATQRDGVELGVLSRMQNSRRCQCHGRMPHGMRNASEESRSTHLILCDVAHNALSPRPLHAHSNVLPRPSTRLRRLQAEKDAHPHVTLSRTFTALIQPSVNCT